MADHRALLPYLYKWEGAYSSDPVDRALAPVRAELEGFQSDAEVRRQYTRARVPAGQLVHTNQGVTWGTWKAYYPGGLAGYRQFLAMKPEEFLRIFKDGFWDAVRGDQISNQDAANSLADFAWGSGPGNAIRAVQRVLNANFAAGLAVDGAMGPLTLAAINRAGAQLVRPLHDAREAFLRGIVSRFPEQARYLQGWLNRINDILPDWAKK